MQPDRAAQRYVSRQRLCLRGTTTTGSMTFWASRSSRSNGRSITAAGGVAHDIVPRLLKEVPGQPTAEELEADRSRARFVILFDREGYSPEFFKAMWQTHRIACITYHKYPRTIGRPPSSRRSKPRCRAVSRSRCNLPSGGVGSGTARTGCGAGGPQADHQWASGQPDQHGFWRIGGAERGRSVQPMVPGKTSSGT